MNEKTRIITVLFIAILLMQYLFIGCDIKYTEEESASLKSNRKLYTGYEFGVNYITHIYTLANAGFRDDQYVKKYCDTISNEDLLFLKENSNLMQFSRGINGKFASMFYFLPAYNNFEDKNDWENYFLDWEKAIKENNEDYIKAYCIGYGDDSIYQYYKDIDDETLSMKAKRLGEIYVNNFETYKTKVWPNLRSS